MACWGLVAASNMRNMADAVHFCVAGRPFGGVELETMAKFATRTASQKPPGAETPEHMALSQNYMGRHGEAQNRIWGRKSSVSSHIKVRTSRDDDHSTLFTRHTLAPATHSVAHQFKDPRPTHSCIFLTWELKIHPLDPSCSSLSIQN